MRDFVLDASVVFKWFRRQQRHSETAELVRADYRAGLITVTVPSLLFLELLNSAARRWSWKADAVKQLASDLTGYGFVTAEPALDAVAKWTIHGLSAYDAAYVALAERLGIHLISDDERVIASAPSIALPLASYQPSVDRAGPRERSEP